MAMLAEPKQRKRYNLTPKGKPLYEDNNRFGSKMLEKMGWQKGQGLGANENGSKDFVRIRYKNDVFGLGFEQRDDQWTQHEQSFNGLLETLNKVNCCSDLNVQRIDNESEDHMPARIGFGNTMEKSMKKEISGVSLEERSRQSKARVHYKKFTKGKDITQYSEKDLANIFGKKIIEEQQRENDIYQHLNNTLQKNEDNSTGVQMIYSGISVDDYFKMKMKESKTPENLFDIKENDIDKSTSGLQSSNIFDHVEENRSFQMLDDGHENGTNEKHEEGINAKLIYNNVSVNDYCKSKMDALASRDTCTNNNDTKKKKRKKYIKDRDNDNVMETVEKKAKNKISNAASRDDISYENKANNIKSQENEKNNDSLDLQLPTKKKKNKHNHEQNYINDSDDTKKKPKSVSSDAIVATEFTYEKQRKNNLSEKKVQSHTHNEDSTIEKTNINEPLVENVLLANLIKSPAEAVHTQLERKSNGDTEIHEVIGSTHSANDEAGVSVLKKRKQRSKRGERCNEISAVENDVSVLLQAEKYDKNSSKIVRDEEGSDVNLQVLDIEDIKLKCKSFNIYPISSFCAEKFGNVNIDHFKGSSLSQIEGYGLNQDIKLDVKVDQNDQERITSLWRGVLNKYEQLGIHKKTYRQYLKNAINAGKTRRKTPKLYTKTWKRKNAFQII